MKSSIALCFALIGCYSSHGDFDGDPYPDCIDASNGNVEPGNTNSKPVEGSSIILECTGFADAVSRRGTGLEDEAWEDCNSARVVFAPFYSYGSAESFRQAYPRYCLSPYFDGFQYYLLCPDTAKPMMLPGGYDCPGEAGWNADASGFPIGKQEYLTIYLTSLNECENIHS